MKLTLTRPTLAQKSQALAFRQEFFDCGETVINGSELLDQTGSYEEWLAAVTANASPETVSPDWVVTDTFFALDEAGRVVGIIDYRHTLNGFLKDLGHCGYSVRPTERGKGYATEMLRLLLEHARSMGAAELRLSVERGNAPSIGTILRNGGRYVRSFLFAGEEADSYAITLREGTTMTNQALVDLAFTMLERSYVPYSHFPVGAALLCADGTVFTGCNVENAAFGSTICAERTALVKAVSEGHRDDFIRLAVVGNSADYCWPCGACRQMLYEFAPNLTLLVARKDREFVELPLSELLPHGFGPKSLD